MVLTRARTVKLLIAEIPAVVVVFLILQSVPSEAQKWNCAEDAKGFPLMASRISGQWYEVVRIPTSDVPACVEVIAPAATVIAETYNLQVNYINNVNKQWLQETDSLSFPWNNKTQNGIFELHYSDEKFRLDITFKLVFTDYKTIALVCGYSYIAPRLSLLKVLTRVRQPNADIINKIEKMADEYGVSEHMTWVEQSSKCNGAATTLPVLTLFFVSIYGISKVFGKTL